MSSNNARPTSSSHALRLFYLACTALLFGFTPDVQAIQVIYVKADAMGSNNGSNWANAFTNLTTALGSFTARASNPVEVWVARGTYYPADTANRMGAFELRGFTRLLGGFAGTETASSQANSFTQRTVLSGDIRSKQSTAITHLTSFGALATDEFLTDPNFADNSYNVVRISNLENILDGFVITGGNANGDYSIPEMITGSTDSPGFPITPLRSEAAGGGLYYDGPTGNVFNVNLIYNCHFVNNQAALGGAVASRNSGIGFGNCTFEFNHATWGGGAMYGQDPITRLEKCLFWSNTAAQDGGAIKFITFNPTDEGTVEGLALTKKTVATLQQNLVKNYTNSLPPHLAMIVGSTGALPDFIGRTPSASDTATDMNNVISPYLTLVKPQIENTVAVPIGVPVPLPVYVGEQEPRASDWRRAQLTLFHFTPETRILNTTFLNNRATVGGAASIQSANVFMDMCMFEENASTLMAGAIYSHVFTHVKVVSSAFYKNSGGKGASAVLNALNSRTHLLNCTITENKSDSATIGHAVASTSGSWIDVANCILWNNRSAGGTTGADLFTAIGSSMGSTAMSTLGTLSFDITGFTDLTNSNVQSLGSLPPGNWFVVPSCFVKSGQGTAFGYVGDTVDPKCFYPEAGAVQMGEGYHKDVRSSKANRSVDPILTQKVKLTISSPMIDAGATRNSIDQAIVSSLLDEDLGGAARVQGSRVDIGAYEGGVPPARYYVNRSATGLNNGLDWANAFTNLHPALTTNRVEVWVAQGTYRPTQFPSGVGSSAQDNHFRISGGTKIYGGFQSGATELNESNPTLYPTILSGDIGVVGNDADNAYNVVQFRPGAFGNAIMEGFTITKGVSDPGGDGAGVFIQDASPSIRNCIFTDNRATRSGGAIAMFGYQSLHLRDCIFTNNYAQRWGGAIYSTSFLDVQNCRFENNIAGGGGAVFYEPQAAEMECNIVNVLFSNNRANTAQTGLYGSGYTWHGGAIYSRGALGINYCTFYGNSVTVNSSTETGGAAVEMAVERRIDLDNSILWNNRVTNSGSGVTSIAIQQFKPNYSSSNHLTSIGNDIIEGYAGTNASAYWTDIDDREPQFVNAAAGNFRLRSDSPAINASGFSNEGSVPGVDLDRAPRLFSSARDLGAYEFQGEPTGINALAQISIDCVNEIRVFRLTVSATATIPTGLTYQWEVNNGNGQGYVSVTNSATYQGATTAFLSITDPAVSLRGNRYRLRASGTAQFTSRAATLQFTASRLFVKANATGNASGGTWANAFTNIQQALAIAEPCSQIWVASGTYYPVTNNLSDRNAAFRMRSGIALYGGFIGTETALAQRNWRTNFTILSGNIGSATDDTDNSYKLIYNDGNWNACDATAILDGFTLTGAADGAFYNSQANPTIRNCTFSGNSGGFGSAMRVEEAQGMTVENCIFKDNRTGFGTITLSQSRVTLLNCLVYNNRSTHRVGAISSLGTTNKPGNVRIINCTIADNQARNENGGLEGYGTVTNEIRNSIFWENRAGALSLKSETSQIAMSGGATLRITDSCVDGLTVVTNGNVGFNPLFLNSASGDYSLSSNSPLLDSGDSSFITGVTSDLAGKPRVFGPSVDVGSYETQTNAGSRVRLVSLPESVETCIAGVSPITFTAVGVYDPTQVFQWQINTGSGFVAVTTNSSYQVTTTTNSSTLTVQASLGMNGHQFRVAVPSKSYFAPPVSLTVRLPQIIYVRAAANGSKNGTSWANAFTNLQQALTTADSCSEIWVAAGTYRPTAAPDGRQNFRMKPKLPIYGGFAGTETNRSQRNWTANLAILTNAPGQVLFDNRGDLDRIDYRSILDGFVVRSSLTAVQNNDGAEPSILNCTFENCSGTAILNWESSSTISNCVFVGGGNVAVYNQSASPSIVRSRFTSNRSSLRGAAIFLSDSSSVITDCVFERNSGPSGGAISVEGTSAPTILRSVFQSNIATSGAGALSHHGTSLHLESCLFTDNESGHSAAAIFNGGQTMTVQNCTVTYNRAARYGGGLYSQAGSISIEDSIFWGNTIASSYGEPTVEEQQILSENGTVSVSHSAVQGLTSVGNGNIGVHPLFVGVLPRPYELLSVSPSVNAGSNSPALQSTLDLAGNPRRFNNGVVDMGAYELQANSAGSVSLLSVPVSQTTCVGSSATFSVARSDSNTVVRWEVNAGSGFVNIANNATYNISTLSNVSTLTITNSTLSLNSNAYRIVIDSTGFQSPSAILMVRQASTIYVKQGGAGLTNGTSWANAFSSLEAAIEAASGCSEIWVAQGTYTPSSLSFRMKPLVGIYGGFVGNEVTRTTRDWTNQVTRLVGLPNSSVIGNYGVTTPMDKLTVLDGFFITGSSTNEPAVSNDAASPTFRNCWFQNSLGIALDNRNTANPLISNCRFSGNRGAIVNINGSSPEIVDCRFENNTVIGAIRNQSASNPRIQRSYFANNQSATQGGAILNQFSANAFITECQFVGNTATESGGAIYNEDSSPALVNLSFQENQASYGGAIYNDSTNLVIRHCTLYANHATGSGGAVFNKAGTVTLLGSILWNNREDDAFDNVETGQLNRFETGTNMVFNSCIEGLREYVGNGNIDVDPLFSNPVAGNLQLMQQSPALNAGNTNYVADLVVDAAGQPRVYGTNVDIGAYELQTNALAPLYIIASPSPISACAGGSSVLTVTLTNTASIQWQVNTGSGFVTVTNGNPFSIVESGSSSSLLLTDMITAWNGYQFRYVLPSASFTSAPVALTISAPSVLYVRSTANGTPNGSSWANAFTNLNEALNLASGCTEIWVASGTYRPTSVDGILVPYRMKSGVGIYGGFAGNESTRAQRNWTNNLTILDAGGQGRLIYNYASTVPITGLAVLDGFTLAGATNNDAALENVSSSPTIKNCTFINNTRAVNNYLSRPTFLACVFANSSGGAMFNSGSPALISRSSFNGNAESAIYNLESNPVIDQSTFTSNSAYAGGAILNSRSSPSIDRCSFVSNSSGQGGGGAVASKDVSKPSITSSVFKRNRSTGDGGALSLETGCDLVVRNSLVAANSSDSHGGAIAHAGGNLKLDNCTIADNSAKSPAGGIYSGGTTVARNTIVWGNRVVSSSQVLTPQNAQVVTQTGTLNFARCIIQGIGSLSGNSNLASDPLFINRDAGNYGLNDFSPAINGGTNTAAVGLQTDLNQFPRVFANATVDIGAYEFQGIASGILNLTSQPESIVKCAGALAHFGLSTAAGQNYTYTWQKLQGSNFVTIANGYPYTITSNALDVIDVTLAMNGDTFRFLVNGTPYASSPFILGVVPPAVLYVKRNVVSPGNGLSWNNAFATIHSALAVADECSEIWVAAGEYSPNDAVGNPYGLKMKEGVRIYGGFAGTETVREQRNWTNNLCTLTSTVNESSIDAYAPISRGTILDGFVITGAHRFNLSCRNGASPTIRNCTFQNNDIAIYTTTGSAPLFANCVFKNNFGDEAFYNQNGSPELVDCAFSNNSAGALRVRGGTLTVTGTTFSANSTSNLQGAAISIDSTATAVIERSIFTGNTSADGGAVRISDGSTAQIGNSLFHRNRSTYYGGAISHYGAKLTLLNCTVTENNAGLRAGGLNLQGTCSITNSIVWRNTDGISTTNLEAAQLYSFSGTPSIAHSIVHGLAQYTGNQNLGFDPLFVNAGTSNFTLQPQSPGINAGTNIALSSSLDLSGLARTNGVRVDIGAYEATNSANAILLTSTPQSQSVCAGSPATFAVSGTNGMGTSVVWQVNTGSGFVALPSDGRHQVTVSSNASTLVVTDTLATMNNWQYRFSIPTASYVPNAVTLNVSPRGVIYVDRNAAGTRTGASWANAFTNLSTAMFAADGCSSIWVAQGTYDTSMLVMKPGAKIYGGFNKSEGTVNDRNWSNNVTILQGTNAAIIHNVSSGLQRDTLIDGFTFKRAAGSSAAIWNVECNPTIRNCRFEANPSGGIDNVRSSPVIDNCQFVSNGRLAIGNRTQSSPVITNCLFASNVADNVIYSLDSTLTIMGSIFQDNKTSSGGGAINASGTTAVITHSIFRRNSSSSFSGGAIKAVASSNFEIRNSLFFRNSGWTSGAIQASSSTMKLVNCTVTENSATSSGSGISTSSGSLQITNSILWNNALTPGTNSQVEASQVQNVGGTVTIAYSTIQGLSVYSGNNNIAYDPLFIAPDVDDFRTTNVSIGRSPAIDAGLESAISDSFDLAGAARKQGNVDMGAYEQPNLGYSTLSLLAKPSSQSVCLGGTATFTTTVQAGTTFVWVYDIGSGWNNFDQQPSGQLNNPPPFGTYSITTSGNTTTLTVSGMTPEMDGYKFNINLNNQLRIPTATLTRRAPDVIYVNGAKPSNGDGTSWTTAFNDLQSALSVASSCSELWVTAGTYKPTETTNRNVNFHLTTGAQIYGGFTGTETNRAQRNFLSNQTILSGDIGTPNEISDNSLWVVNFSTAKGPVNGETILDGVIVEKGAIGILEFQTSPTIRNCIIRSNSVNGVSMSGSKGLISKSSIIGNSATNRAGLDVAFSSVPRIEHTEFRGNRGGAISVSSSTLNLFNSVISGNTAYAGAAIQGDGTVKIFDSTITGNAAEFVGGIFVSGNVAITNSILWKNITTGTYPYTTEESQLVAYGGATVASSCLQGLNQFAGNSNTSQDPRFETELEPRIAPSLAGDFRLRNCSPLLNNALTVKQSLATDIAGNPRVYGGTGDRGAYELQTAAGPIITFTQQPSTFIYNSCTPNQFGVTASGATTYQWEVRLPGSYSFVLVSNDTIHSGSTTSTLSIANATIAMNGAEYRCQAGNNTFCAAASDIVTLKVLPFRLYVNAYAANGGNGLSWATAYRDLRAAIVNTNVDACGVEIWVGQGTYTVPTTAFKLRQKMAVYGGFNGTETALNERNVQANLTIVDGQGRTVFNNDGDFGKIDNSAVLDGFIIQNSSTAVVNFRAAPQIRNCVFRNNFRAITSINPPTASTHKVVVQNCLFEQNGNGTGEGAALYSNDIGFTVSHCVFRGNYSYLGGAIINSCSSGATLSSINNSVFSGNRAATFGGAVYAGPSNAYIDIRSSTFTGNRADLSAAGAISASSAIYVYNSILWNNSAQGSVGTQNDQFTTFGGATVQLQNTCVQGLSSFTQASYQNVDRDPQFALGIFPASAPTVAGDFRVLPCSPVRNIGSNTYLAGTSNWPEISVDLDGYPRVYNNGTVDLGAYEAQSDGVTPITVISQTTNLTYCSSGTNIFTVNATGTGLTYAWEVDRLNGIGFTALQADANHSNVTTTNLLVSAATPAMNGYKYRCIIFSSAGCSVRSATATLVVNYNVLYVRSAAPAGGNGQSWTNAFQTLAQAMAASYDPCGVQIWVAQGTHSLTASLMLRNATAIYGGFTGTETNLAQRNAQLNKTYLVSTVNNLIASSTALNSSARIDGFFIENHNSSSARRGVSLSSNGNAVIANCVFRNNTVGIDVFHSAPRIENCLFENNGRYASATGTSTTGGISSLGSANPIVDHCTFRGNYGTTSSALKSDSSIGATILNSLFVGNYATSGDAIENSGSGTMVIRNSTIAANRGHPASGGIFNGTTLQVFNSIIWNNGPEERNQIYPAAGTITISNSCMQFLSSGEYLNKNNVNVDPVFVSPITSADAPSTNGNFRISGCSPLLNLGADALVGPISTDLDGNSRLFGTVDMGAYEVQAIALAITQQPTDQVGNLVKTATFNTSANVTNATFQWEINQGSGFTNITDGASYLGTATANLIITNAPVTLHSALYRCRVSSSGCTIPSSSAKYTYQAVITSPSAQSATAPVDGNITVDLGGKIDRNSVAGQTLAVHAMQTGRLIDDKIANFTVNGSLITLDPAHNFKAGERVFVSATAGLLYENGTAVQPVVWEFRTGVSTSVNRSFLATGQQLGGAIVNDVALGDMNGDRLVDALVGTSSGMALWLNDGKGKFTLRGQTLGSAAISSVMLGDVDSDTDLDVIEVKADGTFAIWKNDGSGFLTTSATGLGSNARAVSLGDFNGDGHLDLFVACAGADLVWFNNGTGTFSNSGQSLGSDDSSSVDVGDLDGDGDLDVFVATRSNQPEKVWINNGIGSFSDNGQTLGSATSEKVVLADVNGDFRPDAIVVGANSTVWLNSGAGQFFTRTRQDVTRPGDVITPSSGNSPAAEAVAKVIDNNNTTKWLNFDKLNVAFTVTPTVRPAIVSALGITSANDSPERDPASFRLEGSVDGINFTVITNSAPIPAFSARAQTRTITFKNTVAYNQYRLTFQTLSNITTATCMQVAEVELIDEAYELGGSARSVATGDINGDGRLDLWISYVGNTNQILLNNGLNNFSPLPGTLQNSSSGPLALGDLNGDGALDVFQGNGGANPGSLAWLYINPPKVLNEDTLATFTSGEFTNRFTKGALTGVRIVAPPAHGILQLSGITVSAGQEIPFGSLNNLTYLPATNYFGADSFDWQGATASGYLSDLLSFNLQITGVQDAPIVSGGSITVPMAGTATLLDGGASSVLQNASDPDGDILSASIVTNPTYGSLTLNTNGTFSYTHNGSANFSDSFVFRANDGNGNFTPAIIAISVTQVNVAPTNILLAGNSIAENQAIGTVIGTLSATDANSADTHSFTLVAGTGSTENASFSVVNNQLKNAAIFDYEAKTNYSIRVRGTDNGGLFFEKAFTVSIINVNEAPVVNGPATVSAAEESTAVVATYTVTDPDAVDTVTWSKTGPDAARFTIDSTGKLRFSTAPDFENPQDAGGNNVYDVTVVATDSGANTATRAAQITVTNVADGPAFISLPRTNAIVSLPYSYHIDVLHPKKLSMTVTAPVLPAWLTFNPGGTGIFVSGFAGTDTYGNADGPQAQASFNNPYDLAIGTNGVIYVTDISGARLCKIENGVVTTLPFTFTSVRSVAVDPQGNIYVTDEIGNAIRKISGGTMTTVVSVTRPKGLAVDDLGNIYFTQQDVQAISKYTPGSGVSIFAGNPSFYGFNNATGTDARFSYPEGLAVDSARNVYVADYFNFAIRKISPAGNVTTLAGNGTSGDFNGTGTSATFQLPKNVAVDNVGNVYVADSANYKVRKIASNGQVSTLAGDGTNGKKDGIGSIAQFGNLYGLAATPDGSTVYIADGNSRVREIGPTPPTISGTPGFSNIGSHLVRLQVSDGLQTTIQEFSITVTDYPPMIGSLTPVGPHWLIRFTALAGQTYIIEYKVNLSSPIWLQANPPVEVSPGVYETYDYEPADQTRFYRMRTP